MGLGDNLMASGMAKGARDRGKRIAFGDGRQILWDKHSEQVFHNNPNVAPPGSEGSGDLEWVHFYKGRRIYNRHDPINKKWIWNYEFKAVPGEIFFTDEELETSQRLGSGYVIIEPNVPREKSVAPNKQWSHSKYRNVAELLMKNGVDVRQFSYPGAVRMPFIPAIKTTSFRHALSILKNSALYIGPEGGLHHGSAAVGIPAVVLFGGFIPPQVTGYDTHTNLTGGFKACGSLRRCNHCATAMDAIKVLDVYRAAVKHLGNSK